MTAVRAAALLATAVLVAGCGVGPQAGPEDLDVEPVPGVTTGATAGRAGPSVELWFLREDRLASVRRPAEEVDVATALELLAAGPTSREADAGLDSALAGLPLTVDDAATADGVLGVGVPPSFAGVAGEDQLRAVAQVVFTATGFDGVDAVAFTADGEPLEVPTDGGLADRPVDRDDYSSLAPAPGDPGAASTAPPARPSPTGRRPTRRRPCGSVTAG